ncbi:MAG: hypothetical protein AB7G48_00050 [Nitrospiraceae bacterium]
MTRVIVSLLGTLFLTSQIGCLRGPVGWQRVSLNQRIAAEDVRFIIDGQTSLADVVAQLGSPDELLGAGEHVLARYHFTDGKYFRANFGWGLRFLIPYYSPDLVLGGGGIGTDIFQVACDAQWIVREHAFATHANSSEFRLFPFGD